MLIDLCGKHGVIKLKDKVMELGQGWPVVLIRNASPFSLLDPTMFLSVKYVFDRTMILVKPSLSIFYHL